METITIDIKNLIESIHMDSNGNIKENLKELIDMKINACIEAVKK